MTIPVVFPDFNKSCTVPINSRSHMNTYDILATAAPSGGGWQRIPHEYLFKCQLRKQVNNITFTHDELIKVEVIYASSLWQIDAMWSIFVISLRVFRMGIDEMPLLLNDNEELIRHYSKWRLEHCI